MCFGIFGFDVAQLKAFILPALWLSTRCMHRKKSDTKLIRWALIHTPVNHTYLKWANERTNEKNKTVHCTTAKWEWINAVKYKIDKCLWIYICVCVCVSGCLKMSMQRIWTVHHWFWDDGWWHRHHQHTPPSSIHTTILHSPTYAFLMKAFASSFQRGRMKKKTPCRMMKWGGEFVEKHLCLLHHTTHHSMQKKKFMLWHLYSDVFHSWNFYDEHHFINLYFISWVCFFSSSSFSLVQFSRLLQWTFRFVSCHQHAFVLWDREIEKKMCWKWGRKHKIETYAHRTSHTYNFIMFNIFILKYFFSSHFVICFFARRRHHHNFHF